MRTSKEFDQVIQAIHNVQQGVENITRSSTADTGKFSYKYADMPTIWNAIKGKLKSEKLTVVQSPTSHAQDMMGDFLNTTIYHSSGQWISDTMRLISNRDDAQGVGAAITYAKRYALTSMLGLVTDEDNDANNQRMADGEMKKEWVRTYVLVAKKADPTHVPTNLEFIQFMTDVYGKHPTKVYAKEHQQVLDTINAFSQ